MIAHRKQPLRLQKLWLVYIGAVLATLLLAGCGNSMASTATGDPGGTATGGKADVVGQVDGAPVYSTPGKSDQRRDAGRQGQGRQPDLRD